MADIANAMLQEMSALKEKNTLLLGKDKNRSVKLYDLRWPHDFPFGNCIFV